MKKKTSHFQTDAHKRSAPRTVALQSFNCHLSEKSGDPVFRAHLINISATGSQIYSSKPMDEGTMLSLEIWDKEGLQTLEFHGKVVWARKNALKFMGRYAYGVHFMKLTDIQQDFVASNFSPEDLEEAPLDI
jgi:c-di-GMP-binding flagellar brake protein YcgR